MLMKNQMSQGAETVGGTVESNLNTGVQVGLTFQEIVNSGNVEAMKVGIVMEHGKPHDWTEEELKKVQLVLMKNQVTQGVATIGGTVEANTQIDLGLGAISKAECHRCYFFVTYITDDIYYI